MWALVFEKLIIKIYSDRIIQLVITLDGSKIVKSLVESKQNFAFIYKFIACSISIYDNEAVLLVLETGTRVSTLNKFYTDNLAIKYHPRNCGF